VEVAGGVSGRFEARVMGEGPGAVAGRGRSPPAGPAVASVHTFSSGCAAAPSLLEQHKGFETDNPNTETTPYEIMFILAKSFRYYR